MTRFARAKGSKASNERVPENATSWVEMKDELKKTQNAVTTKGERAKMNEQRQKTYDEFVDGEEQKVGKKWAQFPGKKTPMKAKLKINNKNQRKRAVAEADVTDDSIDAGSSDGEIDPKVEEFKKEIESVLKKNKKTKVVKDKKVAQQKRQLPKNRDNKEHKRRKSDLEDLMSVTVNGETKKVVRFDGFPILENDAERLKELRKSLTAKGVPQSEVKRTLQNERRKAEKYLSRVKKHVCFNCRKSGHMLSDCPDLSAGKSGALVEHAGTGICFRCGSTEHKLHECKSTRDGSTLKYASCFICREQGHIARECPDNPRGLYPQGGACRGCGDVTHMKKDCPQNGQEQAEKNVKVSTIANGGNIEALGDEGVRKTPRKTPAKKVVKF